MRPGLRRPGAAASGRFGVALLDHALIGRARVAGGEPGLHVRRGLEQGGHGHGVAHHLGHVDVRHREAAADEEGRFRQRRVQHREGVGEGGDGGLGDGFIARLGRVHHAVVKDVDGVGLDLGHRPDGPLGHQPVLVHRLRAERAAEAPGQVQVDGEAFVEHQPIHVTGGDAPGGIHLEELGRARVDLCPGGARIGQAAGLDDGDMGEVLPHFVQQPDVARGAGAGDAVEGDHGCGVPPRGWRVTGNRPGQERSIGQILKISFLIANNWCVKNEYFI